MMGGKKRLAPRHPKCVPAWHIPISELPPSCSNSCNQHHLSVVSTIHPTAAPTLSPMSPSHHPEGAGRHGAQPLPGRLPMGRGVGRAGGCQTLRRLCPAMAEAPLPNR